MNKFKVGDRVVCSNPEVACKHKTINEIRGVIATVVDIINDQELHINVDDDQCRKCQRADGTIRTYCCWYTTELSLLKMNRNGANE